MNEQQLTSLLRRVGPVPERRGDCPTDQTLASYIDGQLGEAAHGELELHLADCGYCMARVGMLGRAVASEEVAVPEALVARAGGLAGSRSAKRAAWLRPAARWAAAAVVGIGLVMAMRQVQTRTPTVAPEDGRAVRAAGPLAARPRLLWPTEGAVMDMERAACDWSPVSGSLYYQLRVVDDVGDLVWHQQVEGTHWDAPPELRLTPGAEYFLRVDAYLTPTKTVSSDFVAFRLAGRR